MPVNTDTPLPRIITRCINSSSSCTLARQGGSLDCPARYRPQVVMVKHKHTHGQLMREKSSYCCYCFCDFSWLPMALSPTWRDKMPGLLFWLHRRAAILGVNLYTSYLCPNLWFMTTESPNTWSQIGKGTWEMIRFKEYGQFIKLNSSFLAYFENRLAPSGSK